MKNDLMRRLAAGFTALALSVSLALPVFADDTEPLPEQKPTVHITTVDELLQLAKDCSLDTYSTNRTVLLVLLAILAVGLLIRGFTMNWQ